MLQPNYLSSESVNINLPEEESEVGNTFMVKFYSMTDGKEELIASEASIFFDSALAVIEGSVSDEGDAICFQYENEPAPMCWYFWQTDRGLEAEQLPQGFSSPLLLDFVDTSDILCGEYLGVKADAPVSSLLPPRAHP